jgi:hypothetical protein
MPAIKNAKIPTMKIYVLLIPFVVGVFLTVFVYQAVTIFQLRKTVSEDHANLTQVINFLNNQIQAAQAQQQPVKASPSPAASSGTTTKK